MIFLKRTKPIVVRFYTNAVNAHRLFKPMHVSNFRPEWVGDGRNLNRSCMGLKKMFSSGIALPLWSDLDIKIYSNQNNGLSVDYEFSDRGCSLEINESGPPASASDKICIKINSPWVAECDEEINFVATENMWTGISRGVEFMSGVLDFRFQNATSMFLFVNKRPCTVQLNAGDVPIIYKQQSERDVRVESFYDPEKFAYISERNNSKPFRNFNYSRVRNLLKR